MEITGMSTQMLIKINPNLKEKLDNLARREGKSTSQVVREVVENHIKERDVSTYIDDLWDRIGRKIQLKKVKLKDIEKIIKEVRQPKSE